VSWCNFKCMWMTLLIHTHAKTSEIAADKLTHLLARITHWLNQSCLSLNVNKNKGIFFSKTKIKPPDADIFIRGERMKIVNFKYLGIILDQNLNYKKHVKRMVKTMKYNLANLKHIRNCLSLDATKKCMHAMILSHMSYCISCWWQDSDTTIRPLDSLYK